MKKRNIVLIILILLFIVVFSTACEKKKEEKKDSGVKIESKDVKTTDEEVKNKKVSFICDSNKKIKIDTPESWTAYDDGKLNNDSCIELRGTEKDKYLIVISEEKGAYDGFNSWYDIVYNHAKQSYDLDDSTVRRSDEGGLNTRFLEKEIEVEGEKMYLQLYFMETNNYYNQVLVFCDVEDKSLYSAEFRDIAFSLKEIE